MIILKDRDGGSFAENEAIQFVYRVACFSTHNNLTRALLGACPKKD